MTAVAPDERSVEPFQHQALLYADDDDYLAATIPFIEEGLADGGAVLVVVPERRVDLLSTHLIGPHERLRIRPMEAIGRNPAWIIPAWADFAAEHAACGRPIRVWANPSGAIVVPMSSWSASGTSRS